MDIKFQKVHYDDFIGVYDNVYPDGFCEHIVSEFDRMNSIGLTMNRQQSENISDIYKKDTVTYLSLYKYDTLRFKINSTLFDNIEIFFNGLQSCFEDYVAKFGSLKNERLVAKACKLQCTPPGGGYHLWHCEQGNGYAAERVLVYMLYLNTLESEEGGETEFLYQKKRYNPTKNQMIIWPANYTHLHRGNTVLGQRSKYIATGWFFYE